MLAGWLADRQNAGEFKSVLKIKIFNILLYLAEVYTYTALLQQC